MRDRHDDSARVADERKLTVVVDVAEARGGCGVHVTQREEPEIDAVGREPLREERGQGPGVIGMDGPKANVEPVRRATSLSSR